MLEQHRRKVIGAHDWTRTSTLLPAQPPKGCVSANFTTRATGLVGWITSTVSECLSPASNWATTNCGRPAADAPRSMLLATHLH